MAFKWTYKIDADPGVDVVNDASAWVMVTPSYVEDDPVAPIQSFDMPPIHIDVKTQAGLHEVKAACESALSAQQLIVSGAQQKKLDDIAAQLSAMMES